MKSEGHVTDPNYMSDTTSEVIDPEKAGIKGITTEEMKKMFPAEYAAVYPAKKEDPLRDAIENKGDIYYRGENELNGPGYADTSYEDGDPGPALPPGEGTLDPGFRYYDSDGSDPSIENHKEITHEERWRRDRARREIDPDIDDETIDPVEVDYPPEPGPVWYWKAANKSHDPAFMNKTSSEAIVKSLNDKKEIDNWKKDL